MNYKMISLDISTKKTGYALYSNGELFGYGCIECDEKCLEDRMKNMATNILNVIDLYSPNSIYIEETVVNRNVQVQRYLTRLQGVVYGWCISNNCEFNTLRPSEWRKLVGIDTGKKKRKELKEVALKIATTEFNIDNINDDTAEAILIGKAAINKFNGDESNGRKQ